MVQGDSYSIDVEIKADGTPIDVSIIETVECTLFSIKKYYPEEITYSDGKFHFPVTQEETFHLPAVCPMQVRVKFLSGDVVGSIRKDVEVCKVISRVVL